MPFLKAFQVKFALHGADCDAHYYKQVDGKNASHAVDHARAEMVLIVKVKEEWEQTKMVCAQLQAHLIHDFSLPAQVRVMRPWIAQIDDIQHIGEQEDMDTDVRVIKTWNCDDWVDKPSDQEDHRVGIFAGAICTNPQVQTAKLLLDGLLLECPAPIIEYALEDERDDSEESQ